jgi:hypothetical protein
MQSVRGVTLQLFRELGLTTQFEPPEEKSFPAGQHRRTRPMVCGRAVTRPRLWDQRGTAEKQSLGEAAKVPRAQRLRPNGTTALA